MSQVLNVPTRTHFLDTFSREVWETTYKDHNDQTIDDTMMRVASAVASVEETEDLRQHWTEKFYDMLSEFKVTAGGRIYSNAGTEWKGTTLMNCYVSPRSTSDIDSIDAILTDVRNQCQTLKSEGGWGQNFSFIRPRGAFIHGIGVESPGAVKYMEIYDKTSDVITSGSGKKSSNKKAKGKIRKGAMMGIMDCWHPDIVEFVTAKQTAGRLSKFNVSVNCTNDFMDKVLRVIHMKQQCEGLDEDQREELELRITSEDVWSLRFPDTTHPQYKTEWDGDLHKWENKGYGVVEYRTISALGLWNMIMESTYNRAEPGVLFLDRANYYDPMASYYHTIVATNPCGEQTLPPGGVCNLGSLNLTQFIREDRSGFDLDRIRVYVRYLNRFLDNVNSLSHAPLPEYIDSMRKKRRIGIGILGWGSALFMLNVRFGSDRAGELREQIMSTIAREAYMSTIDLAEEKGAFEYCDPVKHVQAPFVQNLGLSVEYLDKASRVGFRNSSLLSCQPTGNTSIFANVVSGGIEPIFMPEYIRTVIVNHMPDEIESVCPKWFEGEWFETDMFKFAKEGDEDILKGIGPDGTVYKIDTNRGLTKEVLCQDYGVRWLNERGEWDPSADWAVTTTELTVDDHVNDLKGFARWIDSAVSKTVNIPNDYPYDAFKEIYTDAYKSGYIKGITTYRSGTMTSVLSAKDEKTADIYDEEIILDDIKLPNQGPAQYSVIRAEGKKWYLTTVLDEMGRRPVAFFVHTNAHEKSITTSDAVERLLALARNKGIPEKWITDTEAKINNDSNATKITRCISLCLRHGILIRNIVGVLTDIEDVFVGSFLFQIRKYLMSYIKDGEKATNGDCPECGAKDSFVYSEGCIKCNQCGYSKCG